MNIILTSPSGREWKISPVDSGLCFQIFKKPVKKTGKNGKKITAEWLSCDRYPSTLSAAIQSCIELMQSDPDDTNTITLGDDIHMLREEMLCWFQGISYEIQWIEKKGRKTK